MHLKEVVQDLWEENYCIVSDIDKRCWESLPTYKPEASQIVYTGKFPYDILAQTGAMPDAF